MSAWNLLKDLKALRSTLSDDEPVSKLLDILIQFYDNEVKVVSSRPSLAGKD